MARLYLKVSYMNARATSGLMKLWIPFDHPSNENVVKLP